MKIQTIHINALGRVLNDSTAHGVQITTDSGQVFNIVKEGSLPVIKGNGFMLNLEAIRSLLDMVSSPANVLDELVPQSAPYCCYECGRACHWLAPDSRCSRCTRYTRDEIIGGS